MICPKCKAEYVRGISVCVDCDVPLVNELPKCESKGKRRPLEKNRVEFKEIYIAISDSEMAMIRSLLDAACIDYYFSPDKVLVLRPVIHSSRLFVREDQCEEAMEIIENLDFGV